MYVSAFLANTIQSTQIFKCLFNKLLFVPNMSSVDKMKPQTLPLVFNYNLEKNKKVCVWGGPLGIHTVNIVSTSSGEISGFLFTN